MAAAGDNPQWVRRASCCRLSSRRAGDLSGSFTLISVLWPVHDKRPRRSFDLSRCNDGNGKPADSRVRIWPRLLDKRRDTRPNE